MANEKEPFIPKGDRPAVKPDLDKPVSELTVRDLHTILSPNYIIKARKDFYKEGFKEYFKDFKEYEYEKDPRIEIYRPGGPIEEPFSITQLVEHVGGLHKKIDQLTNQIAELKKSK
jgi:hypothetical protein